MPPAPPPFSIPPMLPPSHDPAESAVAESDTRVEKPSLYRVLLHNDDFTTMDFVVEVLESVFNMAEAQAMRVMLAVHVQGVGVAGVYTFEIAEMKVSQVIALAQANEFPLLCTMEEE
jgi:ATP-dependent Clp protease adaptor protein ClpS